MANTKILRALKSAKWCRCMKNINAYPHDKFIGSGCDTFNVMRLWQMQLPDRVQAFDFDDRYTYVELSLKPKTTRDAKAETVKHVFASGTMFFKACDSCSKKSK